MKWNIKSKVEPYAFHFTKSDTAIFNILPTMRLRLNELILTNDPREKRKFEFGAFEEFFHPSDKDYFEKRNLVENRINKKIKENCKVLCFCQDYFEDGEFWDGFNHSRMWSQYSENHRGVCLKIDLAKFKSENKSLFESSQTIIKEVTYKKSIFDEPYIDYPELQKNEDRYLEEFKKNHIDYLYFRKDLDWKTEHELRVIHFNENETYCSIKESLVEIILGMDFEIPKMKVLVKLLANELGDNLIIYQADYYDGIIQKNLVANRDIIANIAK